MEICLNAKRAAQTVSAAPTQVKNRILFRLAELLDQHRDAIKSSNEKDLAAAHDADLNRNLVERLRFGDNKINDRIRSVRKIAELPDPVGQLEECTIRPNGLRVARMRVPLGVILMVYEARPHVTVNASAFSIKSGNSAILKGGAEAFHTNKTLGELIHAALDDNGIPPSAVQFISTSDRAVIQELLQQQEHIDLVIPRGGEGLIKFVNTNSKIPVIKHFKGVCHCYIDAWADIGKALEIVLDSKMLMPEVCNALETLLVHQSIASDFLPHLKNAADRINLELRGCSRTRFFIDAAEATEEDWRTEYLDTVLSIRVVESIDQSIEHISTYGSKHTDAIVTESITNAEHFVRSVDSSVVLVNASTMFNDGEEIGLGAEIGISTDKLHARGPMGLRELTTYKFVISGDGHCKKS